MLLPGVIAKPGRVHGLGLFATETIPTGTVVWHPCKRCPTFSVDDLSSLGKTQQKQLDEYVYYLEDGRAILPCTMVFLLNHSCEASILDYGLDFGVAVRDIVAGEELTQDYRTFANDPDWGVKCFCGADDCAGIINPAKPPSAELAAKWTAKVTNALKFVHCVPQPLHTSLTDSSSAYHSCNDPGFILDPSQRSVRKHPVSSLK